MWSWMDENSDALQGLGAVVTSLAALAAIIIIPLQIEASENIQQRQAARDMYRGFVQLTLERPKLANSDYCELTDPDEATAYASYMEYMMYTAEQLIKASAEDWTSTMQELFALHSQYFCAQEGWDGYNAEINALIDTVRENCDLPPDCAQEASE